MSRTQHLFHTARCALYARYGDRLEIDPALSRALVSYQANRNRPFYRWFKYKEAFSAALVDHILDRLGVAGGRLLDPFAGTGATLLLGRQRGWDAVGIELMPIGVRVIKARLAADRVAVSRFVEQCRAFADGRWKVPLDPRCALRHLPITEGAFPARTETQLNRFRTYLGNSDMAPTVRTLLELACLSVLETISYTRKDGQYLRWDHRAPRRRRGTSFSKGAIPSFEQAMARQLDIMQQDLAGRDRGCSSAGGAAKLKIVEGSCLDRLQGLPDDHIDLVITSPPYCNRYDYTRTYALELAFLGCSVQRIKQLRQALLSCTVENRSKQESLRRQYARRGRARLLDRAAAAFERQEALQEVLSRLDHLAHQRRLNNSNVPRMVRNYFFESAVVLFELGRIVRRGGYVVMVNDNVQYGGEEIPVDLILSEMATAAGFTAERIWVLPKGKGNSSQQMGRHGRKELRKCVCLWRR